MTLTDTIHQSFKVGKGDVPTIKGTTPAYRRKLRLALLADYPEETCGFLESFDPNAFGAAMAAFMANESISKLQALRSDIADKGTHWLDVAINEHIEQEWAKAEDERPVTIPRLRSEI